MVLTKDNNRLSAQVNDLVKERNDCIDHLDELSQLNQELTARNSNAETVSLSTLLQIGCSCASINMGLLFCPFYGVISF